MLLSASKLKKSYQDKILFDNLSFSIEKGEKIGIVGKNGCGKSTLIKILVGEIEPDKGTIEINSDIKISYLSQYQNEKHSGKIFDIVISSQKELLNTEKTLREMEDCMNMYTGEKLKNHLTIYHNLMEDFEKKGGYEVRSRACGILKGLGFIEEDFYKDFNTLSGGQMTRVSLAKNLLKKPDLLILDEPTNHLDIKAIEWLEKYLSRYDKSLIIVSHDRYFLDNIVNSILDLDDTDCRYYKGNYSTFLQKKQIIIDSKIKAFKKQQDKIKHENEVITTLKRFNREKSIKRAESRQKILDKIEPLEEIKDNDTKMRLSFKTKNLSGNDVLKVTDLSKSFKDKILFNNISFSIKRGDRIAILGDNGTGKTTILKIINNLIPFDNGNIKIGSSVDIAYFDQTQENLSKDNTVFSELRNDYKDLNDTKIRNTLAYFDFKGDEVNKYVRDLSGGEKSRLSLSKLMLKDANFLILDEPTNHLDIKSKEILEDALISYEGTILFVSHDRFFINKIANRIMILENNKIKTYLGNYDDFLHEREKENLKLETNDTKVVNNNTTKLDFEAQKKEKAKKQKLVRIGEKLEEEISQIEDKIKQLKSTMFLTENVSNSSKLNEISGDIEKLNETLSKKITEWEKNEEEINNNYFL